jgi:hypothetical protein
MNISRAKIIFVAFLPDILTFFHLFQEIVNFKNQKKFLD